MAGVATGPKQLRIHDTMIFIVTYEPDFSMDFLYFLDQAGGRILSCRTDGSELRTVVADCARHPDGVAISAETGYLSWTNMGSDSKRAPDRYLLSSRS